MINVVILFTTVTIPYYFIIVAVVFVILISVSEDAEIGRAVTQISVIDRDTNTKQNIAYYIIDGDHHSQFTVLPTGYVRIAQPLDREVQEDYTITIAATDTMFVSTVQLHVTVLDVNGTKLFTDNV